MRGHVLRRIESMLVTHRIRTHVVLVVTLASVEFACGTIETHRGTEVIRIIISIASVHDQVGLMPVSILASNQETQ